MTRGKLVFLASLALLGLGAVLGGASPTAAAPTVSSEAVAGTDNIAPAPVTNLKTDVNLTGPSVKLTWTISIDDFVRPAPTGQDFTSGGTFVNVNDVAQYVIWRETKGGTYAQIGSVVSDSTSYTDKAVVSGTTYLYKVTAVDKAGNPSTAAESGEVSLGPPPQSQTTPPSGSVAKPVIIQLRLTSRQITDIPAGSAARSQFESDFKAQLAQTLGIPASRVTITYIVAGSVVVGFTIAEDPAKPTAQVVQQLTQIVQTNPTSLGLGPVADLISVSNSSLDMGTAGKDQVLSKSYTFANQATDPASVLTVSATATGTGFSVSPASLSLNGGQSGAIQVSFTAASAGNVNGTYSGTATFVTNDANNPQAMVNLTATVAGALGPPVLDLSGLSISFATVQVGQTSTKPLKITNKGDLALTTKVSIAGDRLFSISKDTTTVSVAPKDSLIVTVAFAPDTAKAYTATITITSNDPNRPSATVALSGAGSVGVAGPKKGKDKDGNEFIGLLGTDLTVGFDDFFIFADYFGTAKGSASYSAAADFNGDGAINFADFFLFADSFGKTAVSIVQ